MADDYLTVSVDGRPRLIACWPNLQKVIAKGWSAHRDTGKWTSPFHEQKLIFGDWFKLKKGQKVKLDLGIGEQPGGNLGYLLMLEKKGVDYRKDEAGRPILPLFTTASFSDSQRERLIQDFPNFPFDWENLLVFKAQ